MVAAAGCGDSPGPSGPAEVELGTGATDWIALAENGRLDVLAGPQGGHHFLVHARIRNLTPGDPLFPGLADNPTTAFAAYLGDRQVDQQQPPFRLGFGQGDESFYYLETGRLLFLNDSDVPMLYGQAVRLTVKVVDIAGREATDERTVLAQETGAPADASP
jgi:hypothetical protein